MGAAFSVFAEKTPMPRKIDIIVDFDVKNFFLFLEDFNQKNLELSIRNTIPLIRQVFFDSLPSEKIVIFNYGHKEISDALLAKKTLSYRFKKGAKGWRVFISLSREKVPIVTEEVRGSIGVDINEHHLAVTEIDAKGNPVFKTTFSLCTYGKTTDQSKALIGDVCKEVIAFAKEKKKPIISERLDFKKKKASLKETATSKHSRMLSSFSYSLILENIERKAFQEGVALFRVNPAMTSIIGRIKFSVRYGLSTHHAAALCIALRFFKFSEDPSKCPLPERNRRQHVWKFWIDANRKLKTALAAHSRKSPAPLYSRVG